ncbi:ABC transporter substrate-binding protein [Microbacterium oleivorans]|uniref:ABC transporter substrate-binding protein n=1 Tax=Microbacterium oleivorans TaxID=273677 RepID=A0A4R5YG67_9MICO|nr:ABC transporter substrate-binding protein [Microbacterium oleivorans]
MIPTASPHLPHPNSTDSGDTVSHPHPLPRWILAPAALAVSALALSGCTGGFEQTATAKDDSIVVALTGEPSSLDPLFDTNLNALNIFYDVFNQLTTIDDKGNVVPSLATEWSADEALTTWTFTLRDDATFQDGSPVTASDVVFTYETTMANPQANLAGYMTTIDSVEATSDTEVVFHLNTPYAPFDRQVTLVPILPKAVYEADPKGFASAPIGSGPYEVEKWQKGDSIVLTRNDDYFGEAGDYERIEFRFVLDETTRANSLQSGDLDIALLGASQVEAVRRADNVDIVDQQSNRVLYLGFNGSAGPLADQDVRKAADLAIDRTAISDDLMNGAVEPTGQLVAKVTFGYNDAIPATTYDPEAATELLEKSGYDGTPIVLSYPTTGLPQIDQLAQATAGYLEKVGFTVDLDGQEAGTYSSNWFAGQLPGAFIYAFAPSVMDADLPLGMLTRTGGQGYFSNSEIDDLLVKEIAEPDADTRAEMLGRISEIVAENTYYSPLFIDTYTYGSAAGLSWTPRPDGFFIFN